MPTVTIADCGVDTWNTLNKGKLNNGYIYLPSTDLPTPHIASIMDDESSDAALLDQQQHNNRDSNIILLDLDQHQQSMLINNPNTNTATTILTSPQHASNKNNVTITPMPTNKSTVVVNLGPNSTQTITSLQRNNNVNSVKSRSRSNSSGFPITNNINTNSIKPSDNINIIKNNKKKIKFNFCNGNTRSSHNNRKNRLLVFAICLVTFGAAIGALAIYFTGIYHCSPKTGE